jgi:nitrogen PTS system EIIA component
MNVTQYMKRKIISIPADATVRDAVQLVIKHRIGTLPVVDASGKLIGVLKLRDLLAIVMPDFVALMGDFSFIHDFGAVDGHLPTESELKDSVKKIMEAPVSVRDNVSPFYAAAMMSKNELYDVPVTDSNDILVGILSHVDIGAGLMENWCKKLDEEI